MTKQGRIENPIDEQRSRRMQEDRLKDAKCLQNRQYELNQAITQEQHQLNLEIHDKQSKLVKWSIVATIIAALLGAIVGHVLPASPQFLLQEKSPMAHEEKIVQ